MFGLKLFRMGLRQLNHQKDPSQDKQPEINILGRLAKATSVLGLHKNKEDEFDETEAGDPLGTYNQFDETFKW